MRVAFQKHTLTNQPTNTMSFSSPAKVILFPRHIPRRSSPVRSTLPFPKEKAKYHRELEASVDAVERACRLCVDVKKSVLSSEGGIVEKNDSTPVTVADFGVQALVSLELGRLFPSIPLVAEEDSAFLRSICVYTETDKGYVRGDIVGSVVAAVADKACDGVLSSTDVLEAIDRGGKDAFSSNHKPSTYWVLDPIDGTRGFLRGSDALYVVGLALVVDGDLAIGVMGCPNWNGDASTCKSLSDENLQPIRNDSEYGSIMVAHVGCGTWKKKISLVSDNIVTRHVDWSRCFVDNCQLVHEALFCSPDSQAWESLPLSTIFNTNADTHGKEVHLLRLCCGSLCKYLKIASGEASVFILRTKVQTQVKVWDHAAGIICVHEAGGQVTDWGGSMLDLLADQGSRRIIFPSGGVLVTNGILHQELLDVISSDFKVI